MIGPLVTGLILSLIVAGGARAFHMLTRDGVVASAVVGTLVFGFGGWRAAGLLVLFFATSSALTRWQAARKPHPEHRVGRTAGQVLANGIVASTLVVSRAVWPTWWSVVAYAGTIAASTADTWATEVGLLSASSPRLITTGQVVPRGQSGGVTWMGTVGGIVGATVVAMTATLLLRTPLLPVWLAGSTAMLVDSLLGATLEGRRRWIDNNAVNVLATASGAAIAAALARL